MFITSEAKAGFVSPLKKLLVIKLGDDDVKCKPPPGRSSARRRLLSTIWPVPSEATRSNLVVWHVIIIFLVFPFFPFRSV